MQTDTGNNPKLLCAFHALQMSLFPMAIIQLYYRREIGMEPADIYTLQAIFGLFVALFEFPSGYLADRMGYRRTLVVASVLNAIGWTVYSGATTFGGVVLGEAILGVGLSLVSGADAALLYESLHARGEAARFTLWTGRMKFWGQTGEGTAALVAGLLFAVWARGPFVVECVVWIVALLVALRLVEPPRAARIEPRRGHFAEMRALVRTAFVDDRRLRATFVLTVVLGMSTFLPVWMITLFAEENGLPDAWQGVLWAGANYAVAIGALASDPLRRRVGFVLAIAGCIGLVTAGYVGLAAAQGVLAAFVYLLMTFARGVFTPMLHHAEQDLIPSGDRAGFVSLRSLLFRGSFIVLGPSVALLFERFGFRPVLAALGVSFLLLGGLALRAVARADRDARLPEETA